MHTFQSCQVRIHYNSDLSGNVKISTVDHVVGAQVYVEIPGQVLVEFVAEYVRRAKISALESASDEELLGLPR